MLLIKIVVLVSHLFTKILSSEKESFCSKALSGLFKDLLKYKSCINLDYSFTAARRVIHDTYRKSKAWNLFWPISAIKYNIQFVDLVWLI